MPALFLGILAGLVGPLTALALEVGLTVRDEAGRRISAIRPGSTVHLEIEVRDPSSGWPPAGRPRAWLVPAGPAGEPCALRAARLVQRGADPLRERPLDGYRLLLFGPDGELAFVDPRLRLASAHLQSVLRLPATPTLALLDTQRALLWAALPSEGLLRIDVAGAGRFERLATGAAVRAAALLGDGRLATALADRRLVVRDARGTSLAALELPAPATVLVADPLGDRLWSGGPDGISIVEWKPDGSLGRRPLSDIRVDGLVLLPRSRLVLALQEGTVASFDADEETLLARTPFTSGADSLLATPDERFVLAPNRTTGVVSLLEGASRRLLAAVALEDGVEEVGLAANTAYFASSPSARIALLPLAGVEPGRLPPLAQLVAGVAPRGPAGGLPRLVPPPDGRGMLVLAPTDRRVFVHGEGSMLAPSTALPVPFADARGLLAQPLGPRPVGPGRFEVGTELPPGVRDLVLLFTDPPEAHCLPLPVVGDDEPIEPVRRPVFRLHPPAARPVATIPSRFVLELETPTAEPVRPEVLAISTRTGWFTRRQAKPEDPTRFEVDIAFPEPGSYELLVRVPELGLDYADGPGLTLEVESLR